MTSHFILLLFHFAELARADITFFFQNYIIPLFNKQNLFSQEISHMENLDTADCYQQT